MDSRLARALEVEAMKRTADTLVAILLKQSSIEDRLAGIEAILKATTPERVTAAAQRKAH